MTNSDTLVIAKIIGAHGIQGAVRIQSYTTNPLDFQNYKHIFDKKDHNYVIKTIRSQKDNFLVVKFKDCDDRNMAEALKGTELLINKSELATPDEEEFYYNDLIGMKVQDQDGKDWGTIRHVVNYGAGDLLDIIGDVAFMIQFTKDAVPEINLNERHVTINKEYIVLPNKDEDENVEG